ncbi:ABC transporter permease [Halanaerobium salsuginis]|uniref:ABC-2 type transport system permease protein n=1 Tax=Halanaerobium salsuginis TaxID=29563 RepID=A0A1I4L7B7_9FIRM|nr:ABC transporter permease subunit [Halanaerobium salsuginis]SFL86880.1 ABC-2 type transport system permease protein [Halanaerobium salsuginis]
MPGFSNSFLVMVDKEISDHVKSWKFIIVVALILLTTFGSLYSILNIIRENAALINKGDNFLFLKLFTATDGNLPNFMTLISFLGPILGIALGFDLVNSERNRGTISRILAQPIPRDYFITSKFTAAVIVILLLVFSVGFLVMGMGLLSIGLPPTLGEFLRICIFLFLSTIYIAFWLSLGILFSIIFEQAATSALASLAIWLFFTVFYSMIVNIVAQSLSKNPFQINHLTVILSRLSPNYLYDELTTILLTPSIRTLGGLSFQQLQGAIPSALSLDQSLLLVWPHFTALIAASLICFAVAYLLFMRREVRA